MPGSEYKVFVWKPEGKNCIDDMVILNLILKKQGGVNWIYQAWIVTSCGLIRTLQTFGFCKIQGIKKDSTPWNCYLTCLVYISLPLNVRIPVIGRARDRRPFQRWPKYESGLMFIPLLGLRTMWNIFWARPNWPGPDINPLPFTPWMCWIQTYIQSYLGFMTLRVRENGLQAEKS
jgi:hypothetical protein